MMIKIMIIMMIIANSEQLQLIAFFFFRNNYAWPMFSIHTHTKQIFSVFFLDCLIRIKNLKKKKINKFIHSHCLLCERITKKKYRQHKKKYRIILSNKKKLSRNGQQSISAHSSIVSDTFLLAVIHFSVGLFDNIATTTFVMGAY